MIEILEDITTEERVIKAGSPEEFDKYLIIRLRELSESNNIIRYESDVSLNRLIPHRYKISYMPKGEKDDFR